MLFPTKLLGTDAHSPLFRRLFGQIRSLSGTVHGTFSSQRAIETSELIQRITNNESVD